MGESNSLRKAFTTMNKFYAVVAAIALVASSVTPLVADTADSLEQLEQQCQELAIAPANYETAVKWLDLAKGVENEKVRQVLLKAAAAAMLYARKLDAYTKNVKPLMEDAQRFEESLHSDCPVCHGERNISERCLYCHGDGRCRASRCDYGQVEIRTRVLGGWGPSRFERCKTCRGTAKCQYCNGKGYNLLPCDKCAERGWIVTPSKVRDVYLGNLDDMQQVVQNEKERLEWRERREQERREARERYAQEAPIMEARGLKYIDGKWMTPGSVRNVSFNVFQIYEPGHALCHDGDGIIFCLLYSAKDNRNVAEGDIFRNDLYRCGTYSYITVKGAPSTVRQFAIDLEVAELEIERQNQFEE